MALQRGVRRDGVTVYVATSLEAVSETVATLRGLLVVGVPLLILLLAAVTWTVVGRALRPVESIRAEVADISDSALSRRVPEPPGGDEVAQLATHDERDAGPAGGRQPPAARRSPPMRRTSCRAR